jgi:FdhD protein
MAARSTKRKVLRLGSDRAQSGDDRIAVEEPLEIRVGNEAIAVTMRTPGHDDELAAGFCFTEGIVSHGDQIESVETCVEAEYGNVVVVRLTEGAPAHTAAARRELFMSSSCGLCGKQSLDRVEQAVEPFGDRGPQLAHDVLIALPEAMHARQSTFAETGGLHAAALFSDAGELLVLREDVGRHNAVDKVIGQRLLRGHPRRAAAVLLVSGRASFEIVQKAAMARIPIVAAVSAPTSLAVDLAARLDMTLIGFLRDGRMNVYHDASRLRRPDPE